MILDALLAHEANNTKVYLLWVRAHIGIKGNELADAAANACSWRGDILNYPQTSTQAGIVAASKQTRKEWRSEPTYGTARSNYNSKALAAYTQLRTEKGPQKSHLHRIGKVGNPQWHCGHGNSTGSHLTFHCPRWNHTRHSLNGDRKTWEELDDPIWVKTGPNKEDTIEGGEEWFTFLYHLIS